MEVMEAFTLKQHIECTKTLQGRHWAKIGGTQIQMLFPSKSDRELSNGIWHPYVEEYRHATYHCKAQKLIVSDSRGHQRLFVSMVATHVPRPSVAESSNHHQCSGPIGPRAGMACLQPWIWDNQSPEPWSLFLKHKCYALAIRAVVAIDSQLSTVAPSRSRQSRLSRQGGSYLSETFYRLKIGLFSMILLSIFYVHPAELWTRSIIKIWL